MSRARHLLWPGLAAVAGLVLTVQPFRDSDVWWHLAIGRYILAHGIPATEPFSFLPAGHAWVGQQWLYEVALARAVQLGGPGLASLGMGLAGAGAFLLAALSVRRRWRPSGPWLAASLLLGIAVAAQLLGVRGQVASLLLTAAVLCILGRWRDGSSRVLLALPPLFVLWANVHAGFVIGLAVLTLALLMVRDVDVRRRRALALALGASLAATLLNPAGPGLWAYVASTFANPTVTGVVTEWQSPDFHGWLLRLFELQAVLLVIAWTLAPRRDLFDLLLAGLVFAAALEAQRNVSLFALVATPQLATYGAAAARQHLGPWAGRLRERGPRAAPPPWFRSAVVAVVVLATALVVAPGLSPSAAADYEATHEPAAAVTYVEHALPGRRVYSVDTWGGYVAERLPARRVTYLYDETAVFGDAALQHYLDIHQLRPDWAAALRRSGATAAVLPADGQEVAAFLTVGWQVDCRDAESSSVVLSAPHAGPVVGAVAGTSATTTSIPACG